MAGTFYEKPFIRDADFDGEYSPFVKTNFGYYSPFGEDVAKTAQNTQFFAFLNEKLSKNVVFL